MLLLRAVDKKHDRKTSFMSATMLRFLMNVVDVRLVMFFIVSKF